MVLLISFSQWGHHGCAERPTMGHQHRPHASTSHLSRPCWVSTPCLHCHQTLNSRHSTSTSEPRTRTRTQTSVGRGTWSKETRPQHQRCQRHSSLSTSSSTSSSTLRRQRCVVASSNPKSTDERTPSPTQLSHSHIRTAVTPLW